MLRRTSQCLSRRQPSLFKPRCLSTTIPRTLATPTSGFAPTWDKIKDTLKPPIDQFVSQVRPCYTTDTSSPESNDPLRTFTVLTSDPSKTSLQELLDRIPQFQPGNESGLFTDFLLLVTPSYAASLRKQKNVIEQALTRIFPVKDLDNNLHNKLGGGSREAVRLVAAVVDRLPKPSDLSASAVGDNGSEGIALRLIANENPVWKPEVTIDGPRVEANLSDNKYRFLSFHLNDSSTPAHMLPIVQLPLANTIFHNGLSSTLIWRKYAVHQGGKSLVQISEQVCDSHRVKLPQQSGLNDANSLTFSVPLVPLTSARSVVACMGNIIRRLSSTSGLVSQDDTKEAILASHELEQSVTSYHKTRGLSPRAVSVWALVIPEKTFTGGLSMATKVLGERNLPELWKAASDHDTDSSQPNLLTLLQHGARLHKVLSGGGGWGKKAGLLSLDPDSGYGQHPSWEEIPPAQQTEPEYIQGLSPVPKGVQHVWGFEPQELPSIVNKGDYIQFYISPSASSEEALAQSQATTDTSAQTSSNVRTVEFGCIPSTVDDMPSTQAFSTEKQSIIQTYPNHFGALSETGIAMFFGLQSGKASSSNIHDATDAVTKVDVPFCRIRSRSAVSSKPKQAQTGFAFSPTQSLQSRFSCLYVSHQLLLDQSKTVVSMQRREFASRSKPWGEASSPRYGDDTIWQKATNSSALPSKKLQEEQTSNDVNHGRKAMEQAEVDSDSSNMRFRIPKAVTGNAANRYTDSIKGQKRQLWATQTMKDVISPGAFERWTLNQTIPKAPDDIWSSKDIRKAHTLKKRQWKLLKPEFKHLKLETVPSATPYQQPRPKNVSRAEQKQEPKDTSTKREAEEESEIPTRKQAEKESELPTKKEAEKEPELSTTSNAPGLQTQSRTRYLNETFRGFLSPAQQRRAMNLQKLSLPTNESFQPTDALLTRRILNLIAMHEPDSPRERGFLLLDLVRSRGQVDYKVTEKKVEGLGKEQQDKDTYVLEHELKAHFTKWKTAAEELKEALDRKWPVRSRKKSMKNAAARELEEIRRTENDVQGIFRSMQVRF